MRHAPGGKDGKGKKGKGKENKEKPMSDSMKQFSTKAPHMTADQFCYLLYSNRVDVEDLGIYPNNDEQLAVRSGLVGAVLGAVGAKDSEKLPGPERDFSYLIHDEGEHNPAYHIHDLPRTPGPFLKKKPPPVVVVAVGAEAGKAGKKGKKKGEGGKDGGAGGKKGDPAKILSHNYPVSWTT